MGPHKEHPHKIWSKSVQRFERRSWKTKKVHTDADDNDDGHRVIARVTLTRWVWLIKMCMITCSCNVCVYKDVYISYAYFRRENKIWMKLTLLSILFLQLSTQKASHRNILIHLRKMYFCLKAEIEISWIHIEVFVMAEQCGCWSLFEILFAK